MRKDGAETRRKILTACVRLFLQQGYKETSITQITEEAGVTRGSFQTLFPTKDAVLMELVETMFGGQFGAARGIVGEELPPVYTYAVETSIQLALTELNENLRDIYVEVYSKLEIAEYIYEKTAVELYQMFHSNFPEYTANDFYELEIGSAGMMRNYMAKPCDIHFPLEKKLERFLSLSLRTYRVSEKEIGEIVGFIRSLDVVTMADEVMQKLFAALQMKFDFTLSK